MPRHQASPDPTQGPAAAFAYRLHKLRQAAGEPSYRAMAKATHYSHTSLSRAAQGRRFPSWEVTEAFVTYCCGADADLDLWRNDWEDARRASEREKVRATVTVPAVPASEQQQPEPRQDQVLTHVTLDPGTQHRRVYGTSTRPKGAHRAPATRRQRKPDVPFALKIAAVLVMAMILGAVAMAMITAIV